MDQQDAIITTLRTELERGGDPNSTDDRTGLSLLHNFAAIQKLEAIELLLKNGANINVFCGQYGPPLVYALSMNAPSSVQYLLEKGANINLALAFCITSGDNTTVQRLLKLGGDLHCTDYNGKTPFELASSLGKTEICNSLLEEAQSRITKFKDSFALHQLELQNLRNQIQKSNLAAREMVRYKQEVEKYVGLWGLERNKNFLLTDRINQLERQSAGFTLQTPQVSVTDIKQEANIRILEDFHMDSPKTGVLQRKERLETELKCVNATIADVEKKRSSLEMQQMKLLLQLKKVQSSVCASCSVHETCGKALQCGHHYCGHCTEQFSTGTDECVQCREPTVELSPTIVDPINWNLQVGIGPYPR